MQVTVKSQNTKEKGKSLKPSRRKQKTKIGQHKDSIIEMSSAFLAVTLATKK